MKRRFFLLLSAIAGLTLQSIVASELLRTNNRGLNSGEVIEETSTVTSLNDEIPSRPCGVEYFEYNGTELVDQENAVGKTQHVPLYRPVNNSTQVSDEEEIGLITMSITDLWIGNVNHCLFIASLKTDYNNETETYDSTINIQGSCKSAFNAVVGGIGRYQSAVGRQTYEKARNGNFHIVVDLCGDSPSVPAKSENDE